MKRANLLVAASLFSVVFMSPSFACGQAAPTPVFPNYYSWTRLNFEKQPANLKGKDTALLGETYVNIDLKKLKRSTMELVYNESNNPWLSLLVEETGERQPGGSIVTKKRTTYMFEHVNGKWVLVRDFTNFKDPKEFDDFLKEKYQFEFK